MVRLLNDDDSAGFWVRGGAYVVDAALTAIVALIVVLPFSIPDYFATFLSALVGAAYLIVMPVLNEGQTVGKAAAGIAIVRVDGSPLGYGATALRWAAAYVSGVLCFAGYACAAFTKQRRALHDYAAGTRVVRVSEITTGRRFLLAALGALIPVAVLAAVVLTAYPKLMEADRKSVDVAAAERLASLRSAESRYSGDRLGVHPPDLNMLMPRYLSSLEGPGTKEHPGATGVETYGAEACSGGGALRDTGKWGYVADPKATCYGRVFIDCTHANERGRAWFEL